MVTTMTARAHARGTMIVSASAGNSARGRRRSAVTPRASAGDERRAQESARVLERTKEISSAAELDAAELNTLAVCVPAEPFNAGTAGNCTELNAKTPRT